MKARIKGTPEWKDYKEVFGPNGEFLGLETLGYTQTEEEYCKEHGLTYDPDSPLNSHSGYYMSAILPLEAFDLWQEPDWQSFRREAAKDILCAIVSRPDDFAYKTAASEAIEQADELIKQLKNESD